MTGIVPYSGNAPSPFTAQGRALARQSRGLQAETALAALQIRGVEAVTELSFECLADLDEKRRQEAGNNQALNALCAELELIAARKMGRVVSNLYRDQGW